MITHKIIRILDKKTKEIETLSYTTSTIDIYSLIQQKKIFLQEEQVRITKIIEDLKKEIAELKAERERLEYENMFLEVRDQIEINIDWTAQERELKFQEKELEEVIESLGCKKLTPIQVDSIFANQSCFECEDFRYKIY